MKIQNTLTQPELEMVLQYGTTLLSTWKEGQRLLASIQLLKPLLSAELNANKELFSRIFGMQTIPAEIYAAICPDPPRMPEGFECPYCGRLLGESDIDDDLLANEPKEVEVEKTNWEVQAKLRNEFKIEDFSW